MKDNMVISQDALLAQWQGHRNLTRKVIEAFPEDKLFTYSVGGMRAFADLALEMIGMAVPTLNGAITRTWGKAERADDPKPDKPTTKEALLQLWDETTKEINRLWPQITPERFQETDLAFGQWEGKIYWILFYIIDNEIHHRGQGYVYLRTLGIEPPGFWVRD